MAKRSGHDRAIPTDAATEQECAVPLVAEAYGLIRHVMVRLGRQAEMDQSAYDLGVRTVNAIIRLSKPCRAPAARP
jgi:hypothetical protein